MVGVVVEGKYEFINRTCRDGSKLVEVAFEVLYDFSGCTVEDVLAIACGGQSLSVLVGNYGDEAGQTAVMDYLAACNYVVRFVVGTGNFFLTDAVRIAKAKKKVGDATVDAIAAEAIRKFKVEQGID